MCVRVQIFMLGSNSELKYTQRPNFYVAPQLKYTVLFLERAFLRCGALFLSAWL